MNKLSALITELCPNGVEYVPLWSVTIWDKRFNSVDRIKQPTAITYPYLLAADLFAMQQENGDVFLLSTGEQTGWTTEEIAGKYLCTGEVVTMPWGKTRPVADCAKYYRGKFVTADNRIMTSNNTSVLDNKYLYYWFISVGKVVDTFYRGSGIQHPDMAKVLDLQIPLPPLEVQREIVRILDTFTELTARKQQYEYYRNTLLNFDLKIPKVKLKDIATAFYRGFGIKRDDVSAEGVPCVRYGEIYTTYNTWFDTCVSHVDIKKVESPKYFEYGDILFAITGESIEDIAKSVAYVGHEKCLAGGDIVVMKHNQNPRYIAHVLATQAAKAQKGKGKVKSKVVHSNVPSIENIEIPLPSLAVQERCAYLLDNFESICSDLNIGLPAEIEARKKQYEFYRDQLLTFAAQDEIVLTDRQTDRQTSITR